MFDTEIFISCIVAMANPETECSPPKKTIFNIIEDFIFLFLLWWHFLIHI